METIIIPMQRSRYGAFNGGDGWSTIGDDISGNAYVWQFVDPIWQQHLNTQGALDMARLNGFIKSIAWWKLVPSGLNGIKTIITNKENEDTSRRLYKRCRSKRWLIPGGVIFPPAYNLAALILT